jgi:hypothetical protein
LSTSFEQFPLHPALLVGLERSAFKAPTPLQAHTIPLIFDGRDIVAQAKHGAGQTLAFGLPILSLLDPDSNPQALILVPNRDRCMRVWDVLAAIGADTGIRVVALQAGLAMSQQEQMLKRGADVIVGTPGRVKDLVGARCLDLSKVRILVLDGADELIDEGLEREIEWLIERMQALEQSLIFANGMPDELASFAKHHLHDPVHVRLTGAAKPKGADRIAEPESSEADHYFVRVGEGQQLEALISLMKAETPKRAVVFTRPRQELKRLTQQIERATDLRTGCLTRDMSANARSSMLGRFRSGDHRVLVVADHEADGLSVDELTHVFYLGMPDQEAEPAALAFDGHATSKTVYLVTPEAEGAFEVLFRRVPCKELATDGLRIAVAQPQQVAEPSPVSRRTHGPEREPRRRNRLGATKAPSHGHEPAALLSSVPDEKNSTGPLAPLPRLRTTWQTYKVSLVAGRRPNRDDVHTWLAHSTGIPRSSLRSIMVFDDFATVEVESKVVEKFENGLQDKLIGL